MVPIGLLTPLINWAGKYGVIIGLLGVAALGLYGKGRLDGASVASGKLNKQIGELSTALQVEQKNRKLVQDSLNKQNSELAAMNADSETKKAAVETARNEAQKAIQSFNEKAKFLDKIINDQSKKTLEQQCADASRALDEYLKTNYTGLRK
jgi:molecular chaperone DnaK (HSP70)